jgi:anti-anti-sigma factor
MNRVIEMKTSKMGMAKGRARSILAPKTSITYETREDLETTFKECLEQRKTEVILDCKAVSFLDSEGLELLVQMHEELKERGGALKIIGVNPVCRDILMATRLIGNLHVHEDIHEALRGGS